jgi:hypothetical protein
MTTEITNNTEVLNNNSPKLNFGKYNGKTIFEIWTIDKSWVKWFKENYKTKPFVDNRGVERMAKLTTEDITLRKIATELVEKDGQEWRKKEEEKNKVECTSEYITPLKKRITVPMRVEKVIQKEEYTIVTLKDLKGNLAYTYGHGDLEQGALYLITGTPVKHVEKLGKKTTYLNRVVVTNKL